MGLGSFLGGLGKGLLSFVPGGSAISGVADVLGGMAKSGQSSNQNRDTLQTALANTRLGRDKFALDAPGTRMRTALRAAMAQAGPTTLQWNGPGSGLRGELPTRTGGIRAALMATKTGDAKALTDRIMHDELMSQMSGGPSGGNQDMNMGLPANYGKESVMDKLVGGAASGSALLNVLRNKKQPPPVMYNSDDPGA